jgi:hypothetical protein
MKARRGKDKTDFEKESENDVNKQLILIREELPDYNASREYFQTIGQAHPGTKRFNPLLDYSYNHVTGHIASDAVHTLSRDQTLTYQMHSCCPPCFKYRQPSHP